MLTRTATAPPNRFRGVAVAMPVSTTQNTHASRQVRRAHERRDRDRGRSQKQEACRELSRALKLQRARGRWDVRPAPAPERPPVIDVPAHAKTLVDWVCWLIRYAPANQTPDPRTVQGVGEMCAHFWVQARDVEKGRPASGWIRTSYRNIAHTMLTRTGDCRHGAKQYTRDRAMEKRGSKVQRYLEKAAAAGVIEYHTVFDILDQERGTDIMLLEVPAFTPLERRRARSLLARWRRQYPEHVRSLQRSRERMRPGGRAPSPAKRKRDQAEREAARCGSKQATFGYPRRGPGTSLRSVPGREVVPGGDCGLSQPELVEGWRSARDQSESSGPGLIAPREGEHAAWLLSIAESCASEPSFPLSPIVFALLASTGTDLADPSPSLTERLDRAARAVDRRRGPGSAFRIARSRIENSQKSGEGDVPGPKGPVTRQPSGDPRRAADTARRSDRSRDVGFQDRPTKPADGPSFDGRQAANEGPSRAAPGRERPMQPRRRYNADGTIAWITLTTEQWTVDFAGYTDTDPKTGRRRASVWCEASGRTRMVPVAIDDMTFELTAAVDELVDQEHDIAGIAAALEQTIERYDSWVSAGRPRGRAR